MWSQFIKNDVLFNAFKSIVLNRMKSWHLPWKAWSHRPLISSRMPTSCQLGETCQFTSPVMTQSIENRAKPNKWSAAEEFVCQFSAISTHVSSPDWNTHTSLSLFHSLHLTDFHVSTKWMNNKWPKSLLQRSTWIDIFFPAPHKLKHKKSSGSLALLLVTVDFSEGWTVYVL